MRRRGVDVVAVTPALLAAALAAAPPEERQLAELDRVRATIADQIQLSAYDLVDELVHGWTVSPPFPAPTPVVLAGVTVPVGLGTGLQALVENHLTAVLGHHPTTHLQLVHCPACAAVVVRSGPEATVISRGVDDPAVLADLGGDGGRYALFLDLEAEGARLVLRARLTRLTPELPIVWARTLSSAAGAPALLRQPDDLVSAEAARAEYLDVLRDRGPISVPARLAIRTYALPDDDGVPPPPYLWLQTGVELATTTDQAWTASLVAGYSFVPQAYQGILAQARVHRLVSGRSRSHVRPDLYAFAGAAVISTWGPATIAFRDRPVNTDELLAAAALEGPRTSFGALHTGLEVRLGQRLGFSAFLETLPSLADSGNLGAYVRVLGVPFASFGSEVTCWF